LEAPFLLFTLNNPIGASNWPADEIELCGIEGFGGLGKEYGIDRDRFPVMMDCLGENKITWMEGGREPPAESGGQNQCWHVG